MEKVAKIEKIDGRGRENVIVSGTLAELTEYFSYTLLTGYAYNRKINKHPKTFKSLITNLDKAYAEICRGGIPHSVRLV